MKPFQQNIWMLSFVFWVGILSWPIGLHLQASGLSSWYFLLTVGFYFAVATSLSVGYHRLFTHRTFKCARIWHYVFALVGTIAWHGSPIQWVALHITHHRYPDSERDPHYTGWSYLFHKRYRPVKLDLWRTRQLLTSPFHKFIHEYYVLICLGYMWGLWLISPMALLFGYLMPMGVVGLVGGLHQVIAHGVNQEKHARNLPLLEFVIPSMGEWMHRKHHEDSRSWDFRDAWWHLDMGSWVVRAIRT